MVDRDVLVVALCLKRKSLLMTMLVQQIVQKDCQLAFWVLIVTKLIGLPERK